jgi:hypothetical protein
MSTNPQVQNLEIRAMEQRNQLHETVSELKQKVSEVREKFDIKRNVRRHAMLTALIGAGLIVLSSIPIARSFDR